MLKLMNITKNYGDLKVLKGISLEFRKSEFVSILGPSGCGKTSTLNIIGGLDQYTSGDLVINGTSTKNFSESDWDAYRNHAVGFVFQSYNLITHQTILQNVELAMTLSGVSPEERKLRATQALVDVGLGDKLDKKPNLLSGGQMQRVAIARALVNNPDIILADEPTGALDSQTSVQIMEILKEISLTKLVVMVTHNPELAEEYSTRIVRLKDGELVEDTHKVVEIETIAPSKGSKFKKTSMSMIQAVNLSMKNLMTKKGRTVTTAIAGSIGIVGVGLVLALSNGLNSHMETMQTEALSGFPIMINSGPSTVDLLTNQIDEQINHDSDASFDGTIHRFDAAQYQQVHINVLSDEFLAHIETMQEEIPDYIRGIQHQHQLSTHILSNFGEHVVSFDTGARGMAPGGMIMGPITHWQEIPDMDFILDFYEVVAGRTPEAYNEIMLVLDEHGRLPEDFFINAGFSAETESLNAESLLGTSPLALIDNNDFFTQQGELFLPANPTEFEVLFENGTPLTIVGILMEEVDHVGSFLSPGFAFTPALSDFILNEASQSEIALAQLSNESVNVFTGMPFSSVEEQSATHRGVGADISPVSINIFPANFEAVQQITDYLSQFNENRPESEHVLYLNAAEMITGMFGTLISVISYVLIGFAAVSLVVSTVMIGIITYVSVIERTKEIGILRSVGARKKDISRVFTAETLIIGFFAGSLGVATVYLLSLPINFIVGNFMDIGSIASLEPISAVILVAGSMLLTIIAGFMPSRAAAKKDPVEALRA